jgi:hypothetical protein
MQIAYSLIDKGDEKWSRLLCGWRERNEKRERKIVYVTSPLSATFILSERNYLINRRIPVPYPVMQQHVAQKSASVPKNVLLRSSGLKSIAIKNAIRFLQCENYKSNSFNVYYTILIKDEHKIGVLHTNILSDWAL